MVISMCCHENVFIESANEGIEFYVCGACEFACDTVDVSKLAMECKNDTRCEIKTTQFIDQT